MGRGWTGCGWLGWEPEDTDVQAGVTIFIQMFFFFFPAKLEVMDLLKKKKEMVDIYIFLVLYQKVLVRSANRTGWVGEEGKVVLNAMKFKYWLLKTGRLWFGVRGGRPSYTGFSSFVDNPNRILHHCKLMCVVPPPSPFSFPVREL